MALSDDNLDNFYLMNFGLMQHHKYTLQDLDNMLPFERKILVGLLIQHLEEEKQKYAAATNSDR